MSKQANPYFTLARHLEKSVDFDLVKDFISEYIRSATKQGEKSDDVIMRLKNSSSELHDAIMNSCVQIQGELPPVPNNGVGDEWVTVTQAAEIFAVTTTTIHNWIKDGEPPLKSKNLGKRKTVVFYQDLKRFVVKPTRKND